MNKLFKCKNWELINLRLLKYNFIRVGGVGSLVGKGLAIPKYLKLLSIDKTSKRRLPSLPIFSKLNLIVNSCIKIIFNYRNVERVIRLQKFIKKKIKKRRKELNIYGGYAVSDKNIFKVCLKQIWFYCTCKMTAIKTFIKITPWGI